MTLLPPLTLTSLGEHLEAEDMVGYVDVTLQQLAEVSLLSALCCLLSALRSLLSDICALMSAVC